MVLRERGMQMDRRTKLTEVFEDTQRFYTENAALAAAIAKSKAGTKIVWSRREDGDSSISRQGRISFCHEVKNL